MVPKFNTKFILFYTAQHSIYYKLLACILSHLLEVDSSMIGCLSNSIYHSCCVIPAYSLTGLNNSGVLSRIPRLRGTYNFYGDAIGNRTRVTAVSRTPQLLTSSVIFCSIRSNSKSFAQRIFGLLGCVDSNLSLVSPCTVISTGTK